VQFYERDANLVEAVAKFLGAGLGTGEGAIIIATPEHRREVMRRLMALGFDLEALETRGQFVALDAAEVLEQITVNGWPDDERFERVISDLVIQLRAKYQQVHAFGEIVALFCKSGNHAAAIRLEEIWNDLHRRHKLTLFCAYPINAFDHGANADAFLHVCKLHSRVIPTESFTRLEESGDERSRAIAVLQQKAAALEAEIAERRQAEQALAERERELRDFIENATEGIHQVSEDGTILWANKAELEMLGYTAEEYIGHSLADFYADPDVFADILCRLHRKEKLQNYEARLKCKDGSLRYVSINSSVYWKNGAFAYTRCFTRDITDRWNADAARQLLSAIVEGSDDAIASKDLNGVITSWNNGAERLFGYTAAEAIGKPVYILIPEDRHDEEPGILARIRRGERIEHYETVRRRKDGTLIDISLTVSPIRNSKGEVVGASKIARDISERKRVRQKLEETVAERTTQLRETVAELEAFSYSIAHDMRAPLRAMNSYSKFLQEDFEPVLPPQGRDYLRRIGAAATRLDALITDVLNYSRISRGEMAMEKVDVERLTREIIESYPDLHQSGARILVQSNVPPVIANTAALTQCISNLLSNAVKFVPAGTTPQVRVWAEERGPNVRIWVEDNGIGISEAGQKRIFQMFQRLNPPKQFEGSGIGLTIVRKAVQRMGGSIGVESQPGAGSRFWIELKHAD
jgi:PAS domain S-box-containing protein